MPVFETETASEKPLLLWNHVRGFVKTITTPENTRDCDLEVHLARLQEVVI